MANFMGFGLNNAINLRSSELGNGNLNVRLSSQVSIITLTTINLSQRIK